MSETIIVEKFWDDYYELNRDRQTDIALRNLLRSFRQSLDTSSQTANAIDRHYSLDRIIVCAKEEDHLEVAEAIFFAKYHLD